MSAVVPPPAPAPPRRGRRSRLLLIGGVAALLGTAAALVVIRAGSGDGERGPSSGSAPVATSRQGATTPDGAGGAPSASGAPTSSAPAGGAPGGGSGPVPIRSVRYAFDASPTRATADATGQFSLRVVVAAGGTITFPPHGTGAAAKFPPRCHRAPAQCPRAILESARADVFNPGTRPVRYGASVLMTRADTAAGANVVQKGYSTDGGTQFKLQIDGVAGRPSCVLAGARSIYRLVAPLGIADGRWHSVTCTRAGPALSINVDGRVYARQIPASLSITNQQPLRIGGKGTTANNDQYAGQIDDVFVAIY